MLKEIIATLLLCFSNSNSNTLNIRDVKRAQNNINSQYISDNGLSIGGSYYWEDWIFNDVDYSLGVPCIYFDFCEYTFGTCYLYPQYHSLSNITLTTRNSTITEDTFAQRFMQTNQYLIDTYEVRDLSTVFHMNIIDYGGCFDNMASRQVDTLNLDIITYTYTEDGPLYEVYDSLPITNLSGLGLFFGYYGQYYDFGMDLIPDGHDLSDYYGLQRIYLAFSYNSHISNLLTTKWGNAQSYYQEQANEDFFNNFYPITAQVEFICDNWTGKINGVDTNLTKFCLNEPYDNLLIDYNELNATLESERNSYVDLHDRYLEALSDIATRDEKIANLERLLEYAETNGSSGLDDVFSWFSSIFGAMGNFLNIEIANGIRLSHLLAIPIVAAALFFVIKILVK